MQKKRSKTLVASCQVRKLSIGVVSSSLKGVSPEMGMSKSVGFSDVSKLIRFEGYAYSSDKCNSWESELCTKKYNLINKK